MFYVSDGGCGGFRQGMWTGPSRCIAPPVAAGLRLFTEPKLSVWWVFACAEHVEHLSAARPLLDRDRAEIARRRAARPGDRIDPLAVGRAARDLVERAQRWADAHPEHIYRPPPDPPRATSPDADARHNTAGHPFAGYAPGDLPGRGGPLPDRGEQAHP